MSHLALIARCSRCGVPFDGTEKFCTRCGSRRAGLNAPQTLALRQEDPLTRSTPATGGSVVLAILIDCVATVVMVAAAFVVRVHGGVLLAPALALISCVFILVQCVLFTNRGQSLGWKIAGIRCVAHSTGAPVGRRWTLLSRASARTIRHGRDPLLPFLKPLQSTPAFSAAPSPVVTGSLVSPGPPASNPSGTEAPSANSPIHSGPDFLGVPAPGRLVPHYPGSPEASNTRGVDSGQHVRPPRPEHFRAPENRQPQKPEEQWPEEDWFEATVMQALAPFDENERPARGTVWLQIDGTRHALGHRTVIGRNPTPAEGELAIAVTDFSRTMSKKHLLVEHTDDETLFVTDLDSTNGSVLSTPNGQTITLMPHTRVSLTVGSSILIEDHTIHVDTKASAARRARGTP